VDRALALSRLYEKLGTPEHLERAVNICHYLERVYAKITVFGRLSLLLKALGRNEEAAEADARFLEIFRSRMHRAAPEETVRTAAARYVPLDRLREIRYLRNGSLRPSTERERAVASALAGDLEGAAASFRSLGAPIDRKYLGDILLLRGDEA